MKGMNKLYSFKAGKVRLTLYQVNDELLEHFVGEDSVGEFDFLRHVVYLKAVMDEEKQKEVETWTRIYKKKAWRFIYQLRTFRRRLVLIEETDDKFLARYGL